MEPDAVDAKADSFLLAEYGALRGELVKRLDIEHQVLSLAIIAAGTIFIAGVQASDASAGALLLFGYPILATFLAATWGHNSQRIQKLRNYIRVCIEERVMPESTGWEGYDLKTRFIPGHPLPGRRSYAARGVFIGTELFAIIIGLQRAHLNLMAMLGDIFAGMGIQGIVSTEWYFLLASIICILVTILVMLQIPRKMLPSRRAAAITRS